MKKVTGRIAESPRRFRLLFMCRFLGRLLTQRAMDSIQDVAIDDYFAGSAKGLPFSTTKKTKTFAGWLVLPFFAAWTPSLGAR